MTVIAAELGFAPGKSMVAYDDVQALHFDSRGMPAGDREYMWVEGATYTNSLYRRGELAEAGHFLSLRKDPVLTQAVPLLTSEGVELRVRGSNETLLVPRAEDVASNRGPVSVWGWNGEAVDQGDEAAEWGQELLGRLVRLVAVSNERPRYVEDNPEFGQVGFADGYAVTVGSTDSLALVNRELRAACHPEITAQRPRVTVLLDGLELPNAADLPADVFPEDYVAEIRFSCDGLEATLERIKACGRCPIPDTNEVTGERKGAPVRQALGRLARSGRHSNPGYGKNPELLWTQHFIVRLPEDMPPDATIDLKRGAEVEVVYSDTTNWA